MSLQRYCDEIRDAVVKAEDCGFAESVDFREEIRFGKQAVISAEIRFVNGAVLIVKEYIDAKYKLERLRYAYQYHDGEGELIFRYDNAAHKPPLGVKEHKHLPDGKIIPTPPPGIHSLLEEAIGHL